MVRESRRRLGGRGEGGGVLLIVDERTVVVGCGGGGGEGVRVTSVVGEPVLCWRLRRKGVERERSKVFLLRLSLRLATRREDGGEGSPHRASEREGGVLSFELVCLTSRRPATREVWNELGEKRG